VSGPESSNIVVERRVSASPETIFRFFTDPDRWMRWQGVDAVIEARPGGVFRVNVTGDGYASGEFTEVVPDRRVVFTWGWERPDSPVSPGTSIVEIELIPDGRETIVRLTHKGLPGEARDIHRQGWENYTYRLAAVSEERDPGPDPLLATR
jgi:uncharacterized protein YndB with AHSA1/START domain